MGVACILEGGIHYAQGRFLFLKGGQFLRGDVGGGKVETLKVTMKYLLHQFKSSKYLLGFINKLCPQTFFGIIFFQKLTLKKPVMGENSNVSTTF